MNPHYWSKDLEGKIVTCFQETAPKFDAFQGIGYICFMTESGQLLGLFPSRESVDSNKRNEAYQTASALMRSGLYTPTSYGLTYASYAESLQGAIRLSCGICMSVSGFTPEMNEAVAVVIASRFNLLESSIEAIRKISGNQHMYKVLEQIERLESANV